MEEQVFYYFGKFSKCIIFMIIVTQFVLSEDIFENVNNICNRCDCENSKDNTTYRLNCTARQIKNVLDNWPEDGNYKDLIAIFSYNDINRLERLPSSSANSLKIVYSHCNIKEVSSGFVSGSINVYYLDLSYNQIPSDQLHPDIFKGPYNHTNYEPLPTLSYLNLAYNKIHSIHRKLFEHIPNLIELNLEGNQLRILDDHTTLAFADIKNVKHLNLANNGLLELTYNAMKPFQNLRVLDLSSNDFDFVPNSLALTNGSLQVLILDNNPIIEIDGESFLGLKNLAKISANNLTKLHYVRTNAFSHLDKLRKLELSNNPLLTHIDDEAFGSIQGLKELNLSNNNLTSLPMHMINWNELTILNISNNPFVCNCNLYNITRSLPEIVKCNQQDGPTCMDLRKPVLMELYLLKSDVCKSYKLSLLEPAEGYFTNFKIMRMSLVTTSIVLLVVVFSAMLLLYTKWKTYQRSRNYPFASQVVYNPITTDIHI